MASEIERLALKGIISELPEADREKVYACVAKINQVVAEFGDAGILAMALVVSELDA